MNRIYRKPPRAELGFTAVEALVVCAIFSFMVVVIASMFSSKSEQTRDLVSRKDQQQSMRLLYSHLLLDVKGAMGFTVIEEGKLALHYFRNVPQPSIDFTNNLLDGNTTSTQKIVYELAEGIVTRSVDGNVKGSYAGLEKALFVPLTLDTESGSTTPVKGADSKDAVGIFIELVAGDDEEPEYKHLSVKTKIFSETLWCLRLFGTSPQGRPFYPDRGGFFSPLDRCRAF